MLAPVGPRLTVLSNLIESVIVTAWEDDARSRTQRLMSAHELKPVPMAAGVCERLSALSPPISVMLWQDQTLSSLRCAQPHSKVISRVD
jgi:hypothetical protein